MRIGPYENGENGDALVDAAIESWDERRSTASSVAKATAQLSHEGKARGGDRSRSVIDARNEGE
jgi:hypothetical protein